MKNIPNDIPVITIDGPSGVGKGTITKILAQELKWHILDSGALYRSVAMVVLNNNIDLNDADEIAKIAHELQINFIINTGDKKVHVVANKIDITSDIRTEIVGNTASKIAKFSQVRTALIDLQRYFKKYPGLIADGRDMGTVIFPDATLKIFLTASFKERLNRRFNQLKSQGVNVKIATLSDELENRDYQDSQRSIAPLKPAVDAVVIDTTDLSISDVAQKILTLLSAKNL